MMHSVIESLIVVLAKSWSDTKDVGILDPRSRSRLRAALPGGDEAIYDCIQQLV